MSEDTIIIMNDYEEKLLQYRAREQRKKRLDRWKKYIWSSFSFLPKVLKRNKRSPKLERISQHPNLPTIRESSSDSEWESDTVSIPESSECEPNEDVEDSPERSSWQKILLHFIVWGGMFAYAVHIEFGTVYLLLSAFYFMWINTRTRPKKPNEISAYSVFNKNCERIQGTLDAETLEREMKYGFII